MATAALLLGLSVPVDTPADATAGHTISFPVAPEYLDHLRWRDTWGAPRSGGRRHIGVDIMGDRMIPVVAVADGVVTWGRYDNGRGSIVRIRANDGWEYQYIHLNNDRPGTDDGQAPCHQALSARLCDNLDGTRIRRGTPVSAGEVVGYIGDSGNAEWTAPHLHFEVYQPLGDGTVPVNPTPYVDAARDRIGQDPPDEHDIAIDEIHHRLEGRPASTEERSTLRPAVVDRGVAALVAQHAAGNPSAASLDRLYLAFFRRPPDGDGWDYWIGERSEGHRLEDIAEWFAASEEFDRRYGGTSFSVFLDQLYAEVLGREPDAEGKRYWMDRLEAGDVTRGTIIVSFTEGDELRTVARWRSELTVVHRALGLPRPTAAEVEAWRELRATTDLEPAVAARVASIG